MVNGKQGRLRRGLVALAVLLAASLATFVVADVRAQESVEPPADQAPEDDGGAEPPPMGAPHETAGDSPPPPSADATVDEPPQDTDDLPVAVSRISGANRYETAALLGTQFASGGTVFVASGDGFADALAGGPVASIEDAPILLVTPSAVPEDTVAVLDALSPSAIVVLGGTGAVSTGVEDELSSWAPVTRVAGNDRFETAAQLAMRGFGDGADTIYVATGRAFPDALSGGTRGAAYSNAAPILLVERGAVPAATWEAIDAIAPSSITILGGPGVVSDDVAAELGAAASVTRIAGGDRYETSAMIADEFDADFTTTVFLATGRNFPDALAAAPVIGWLEGPTILVPPTGPLPQTTIETLQRFTALDEVIGIGGTGALADDVLEQVYEILNPEAAQ